MEEKKESVETKFKQIGIPIILLVVVILAWLGSWYYINHSISEVTNRGVFGDQFGFINSLFSGLAFAGVIYAIVLQKDELKLQRKELKMTRKELKGQKFQLKAQTDTFQEQTLQNAFFQMLRFHNEIVENLYAQNAKKGRSAFSDYYNSLKAFYNGEVHISKNVQDPNQMEKIYSAFYKNHQNDIGHYFRNLYNIIKFINKENFRDKKYYTNLVRAQLSVHEIVLLFYNCEYGLGKPKFKPLIEKYALLKTLDENLLLFKDEKQKYNESAYS